MTILVTKTNNNNIYNYRRTIKNCKSRYPNSAAANGVDAGAGDSNGNGNGTTSTVLAVTNESESDVVASQLIEAQYNPQIMDLSFHRTNICSDTFGALQTLIINRKEQHQLLRRGSANSAGAGDTNSSKEQQALKPRASITRLPHRRDSLSSLSSPSPPWNTIAVINCEGRVEDALDLILSQDCFRSLHFGDDATPNVEGDGDGDAAAAAETAAGSMSAAASHDDHDRDDDNDASTASSNCNNHSSLNNIPQCKIGGLLTLSRSLESVTHLKSLRITAVMHAGDVMVLGKAIGSNTSLTLLDLSWSCFVEQQGHEASAHRHHSNAAAKNPKDESIIHHLATGFQKNTSLRTLDLFGCNLNDHQMTIILHSLVQHPTLQSLALNDNKCGRKASLAASHVLGHPHCLVQQFDLSFQRVEDAAAASAAAQAEDEDDDDEGYNDENDNSDGTLSNLPNTTVAVDTVSSSAAPAAGDDADDQDADGSTSSPSNRRSGRLNIKAIARAIEVNPSSLLSLDLSSCELVDADAVYLARAIRCHRSAKYCTPLNSPGLQELLLSRNKITNIGIQELARALHHSTISASCSNNSTSSSSKKKRSIMAMDNSACAPVAAAHSVDVSLDPTRFMAQFPKHIHRCQICRGGLRRLSVWGNPFDEVGAQALLGALHGNTDLETLDLFREFECSEQIRHLLNMNRVGRRFLRQTNDGSAIYQDRAAVNVPLAIWSHVLARSSTVKLVRRREIDLQKERASIMFDFLRESPHLYTNS
mmetsp:Transcript_15727/g.44077  ORF Transcript_15727/g.44077 Transcript_15727/m.44077 type:complete len:761 (-) Transcript_15727:61-2343(-)